MKSITASHIVIAAAMCIAVALGAWRLDGPHFALLLGAFAFGVFVVAWASTAERSAANLARRNQPARAKACVADACACWRAVDPAA